uniref:Uncharacterized protein n=1 Tax=Neobodo designis TaxID=312471 RepID=A0A7S1QMZ1_NEODS|mmetsp:Transcript_490/g.1821  ORF Transcript_490/g.1821 Transcript_490/m.1821 type:complete len:455 (+) Transcript_490:31-1395(+)
MRVFTAVITVGLACCTWGADAAAVKLRDAGNADKQLEGDSSEWVKELRKLQRILPEDREWAASINGFIDSHRSEVVDVCNFDFVGCTVQHEVESLRIDRAIGNVDWGAVPNTVTFVTFENGRFTFNFDFSVGATVQSLKYVNCRFGQPLPEFNDEGVPILDGTSAQHAVVKSAKLTKPKNAVDPSKTRLHEIVVRDCQLPTVPWTEFPPVISADLSGNPFLGIPIKSLPRNMRFLNLSFALAADVPELDAWADLPPALISLDLSGLRLNRIGPLPQRLEELVLRNNSVSSLQAAGLPPSLAKLNLAFNALSGDVPDLSAAASLKDLDVTGNKLTSLPFSHLPTTIRAVRANGNKLGGEYDLTALPKTLQVLELADNAIAGAADLSRLPEGLETLDIQGNTMTGPVDLGRLPQSIRFLYLQRNRFTGRPDLSKLPVDLRRIFFGENNWDSLMPPR